MSLNIKIDDVLIFYAIIWQLLDPIRPKLPISVTLSYELVYKSLLYLYLHKDSINNFILFDLQVLATYASKEGQIVLLVTQHTAMTIEFVYYLNKLLFSKHML